MPTYRHGARPIARLRLGFASAMVVALSGAVTVAAAGAACRAVAVDVTGATAQERDIICTAAGKATGLLRQCGLEARERLSVAVTRRADGSCDEMAFGTFHLTDNTIRIASAADCAHVPASSPYAALGPAGLYESIVVHEVAHAVFWQALAGRQVSQTAHEYVAYAIQLQAMDAAARDQLMAMQRPGVTSDLTAFNDKLLGMAPDAYAALAFRHFTSPGHGCAILKGIVSGTFVFPPMPQ